MTRAELEELAAGALMDPDDLLDLLEEEDRLEAEAETVAVAEELRAVAERGWAELVAADTDTDTDNARRAA